MTPRLQTGMALGNKFAVFVLSGVGTVVGFYISGVIDLVGSTTQIPYVIAGIITGAVIFGFLSVSIAAKMSHPIATSSVAGAILLFADAVYVSTRPEVSSIGLLLSATLVCSPLMPVASVAFHKVKPSYGIFLTAGSIIFLMVSATDYIESGYSGLGMITLVNLAVGFLVVLTVVYFQKVRYRHGKLLPARMAAVAGLCFVVLFSTLEAPIVLGSNSVTPIKHVVEIMMENHSFDNIFGMYPGPTNPLGLQTPQNLLGGAGVPQMRPVPNGTFSTADPVEGYVAYHEDWNGGMMNGFLQGSGPQSLLYYTASQFGEEWALAEQYSLGNMYFASQLTETSPNRLYSLAGYSPVINDYGPPPYIPVGQSIFSELSHYDVSWGYYVQNPSAGIGTLDYFAGIGQYSSNIRSWNDFFQELSNNALPSVSWMMPVDGGAVGYSQGPPSNILQGELWLMYVVNAIERSPEWNSTAIFITYDEGGGFYDQVPPPSISGVQLGVRVPLIVVSPYAKENYVSNTVMTHTSILAFIDYNWGLPSLNKIVGESNLPLDMFNFNANYSWGNAIRPAITFANFPMPTSPVFSLSKFSNITSLAYLFPTSLQVPLNQLPYSREGSSNFTLGRSDGYYVNSDFAFIPFYETIYFVGLAYVILLAITVVTLGRKPKSDTNRH